MNSHSFNVRVYGIFRDGQNRVLLCDEERGTHRFTKFPGGGLEYGEGTVDCLIRECEEEMQQPIRIIKHFYTTDFFQPSAFDQRQVLSIYSEVEEDGPTRFETSTEPFTFSVDRPNEKLGFRWCHLHQLMESDLTFPIDRKVLALLKSQYP